MGTSVLNKLNNDNKLIRYTYKYFIEVIRNDIVNLIRFNLNIIFFRLIC